MDEFRERMWEINAANIEEDKEEAIGLSLASVGYRCLPTICLCLAILGNSNPLMAAYGIPWWVQPAILIVLAVVFCIPYNSRLKLFEAFARRSDRKYFQRCIAEAKTADELEAD